jgi:hypothetical protein
MNKALSCDLSQQRRQQMDHFSKLIDLIKVDRCDGINCIPKLVNPNVVRYWKQPEASKLIRRTTRVYWSSWILISSLDISIVRCIILLIEHSDMRLDVLFDCIQHIDLPESCIFFKESAPRQWGSDYHVWVISGPFLARSRSSASTRFLS